MAKWNTIDEIEQILNNWKTYTLWHNMKALNPIDDFIYVEIKSYFEFSEDQFTILKLRYLDGLSYEEIADKLNWSERTIYRKRNKELSDIRFDLAGDFD